MTDKSYEGYEPPTIGVIGSVEELTQTLPKHTTHTLRRLFVQRRNVLTS